MKNIIVIGLLFVTIGCVTTIPTQSNLNDQVLLMTSNKNIKADFHLYSDIPNGTIRKVNVQRDGRETVVQQAANYNSETAFRNMFSNYFSSKFNAFSRDEMRVEIHLRDLYLKEMSATSVGAQILTGNAKSTVEAIAQVYVEIEYNGEVFRNEFQVNASDYRETQSTQYGTFSNTNPTQQMSLILQSTLNRAVIHLDGFVHSVTNAD